MTNPDAADKLVREFLQHMQDRDLKAATRCLHPGFEMTFPGPVTMHALGELIEWGSRRYRSIGKQIESIETCTTPDSTIAWCYGTLFGEWPDGSSFKDIRFVDRFEIRAGLIYRQSVWNDLAEVRN